jgi:hypothetical protein
VLKARGEGPTVYALAVRFFEVAHGATQSANAAGATA